MGAGSGTPTGSGAGPAKPPVLYKFESELIWPDVPI